MPARPTYTDLMLCRSAATLLSCLLVALPSGAAAQAARAPLSPVAGEVIVQFKPGASVTRQVALSARASASQAHSVIQIVGGIMYAF